VLQNAQRPGRQIAQRRVRPELRGVEEALLARPEQYGIQIVEPDVKEAQESRISQEEPLTGGACWIDAPVLVSCQNDSAPLDNAAMLHGDDLPFKMLGM
jgi:hypothetical protein